MPEDLWTEVRDNVQETGIKTIPMEKKCKKAKWLSEEVLQVAVKRRELKSKGEKESIGESPTLESKISGQTEGKGKSGGEKSSSDNAEIGEGPKENGDTIEVGPGISSP